MSLNLNKVILAGRLTANPELKQTTTGLSVCTFLVAVNRKVKAGEHPEADFFTVTAWRNTADFVCKYFSKGQAICVVGSLHNSKWKDSKGNDRITTEIIAESADFVESKAEQNAAQPSSYGQQTVYNPYAEVPSAQPETYSTDDDLPF